MCLMYDKMTVQYADSIYPLLKLSQLWAFHDIFIHVCICVCVWVYSLFSVHQLLKIDDCSHSYFTKYHFDMKMKLQKPLPVLGGP